MTMSQAKTSQLEPPVDATMQALAARYVDLVYASARRQVGDAHLAEDVTQAVFIILAQKLPRLPSDRPLGAWLLRTTAYVAANARRRRAQREFHERRAAEMARDRAQSDPSTESHWDELSPLLDEGVNRLRSGEREALVLRYFEKMSLGEVGAALGITEAAAGKRVSRAVEKLRAFFQRRGVSVSATALATVLAVKTTEAAPMALVSAVSTGTSAAAAASPLKGSLIVMASTKSKLLAAAAILLLVGTSVSVVVVKAVNHSPAESVPAVATPDAPEASQHWPIVFHDGSVVEVVGVSSEDHTRWWAPDGREIAPLEFRDNVQFTLANPDGRNIRFVIRRTGNSASSMNVEVGPMFNYAATSTTTRDTTLMQMIVAVPATLDSTSLRIALAGGSWNDVTLYNLTTSERAPQGASPLSVGTIKEDTGKTLVQIFDTRIFRQRDRQETVIVRAGGQIVFPKMSQGNGLFSGVTYTFECPLDQVTEVIHHWRPYDEWMEMRNLSLRPTTQPTEVSVGPATQPTTGPGVK
jgi:RNA polymerase sigma factor (sigma-70 family)